MNTYIFNIPIIKPANAGGRLNFSAKNFGPNVAIPLTIAPSVQVLSDINKNVGLQIYKDKTNNIMEYSNRYAPQWTVHRIILHNCNSMRHIHKYKVQCIICSFFIHK